MKRQEYIALVECSASELIRTFSSTQVVVFKVNRNRIKLIGQEIVCSFVGYTQFMLIYYIDTTEVWLFQWKGLISTKTHIRTTQVQLSFKALFRGYKNTKTLNESYPITHPIRIISVILRNEMIVSENKHTPFTVLYLKILPGIREAIAQQPSNNWSDW